MSDRKDESAEPAGALRTPPDAVTLLTGQHQEVEELFLSMERLQPVAQGSTASYLDERRRLTELIVAKLMQHAGIEELQFYPALRRHLSEGDELVTRAAGQHAEAEAVAGRIDGLSPDNVDFDSHLRELIADVREHVRMEETEIFPRIRAALSEAQLLDLGAELEKAMKRAPTHPHPHTPPATSGVGKVLAKGAAVMDRMRDAATGREHD